MTRALRGPAGMVAATVGATFAVGYACAHLVGATVTSQLLPWIVGRGLGVASYLFLVALTVTGLWLRHPLRMRWRRPSAMTLLWVHAGLVAGTLMLIVGHVVALALDHYAGVGWAGALLPGRSGYRPLAVGLGTVGLYVGVLAGGAVGLAGRLLGRSWLAVHRFASLAFALVWAHGLLAGSDTPRLWWMYLLTGGLVAVVAATRRLAAPPPGPSAAAPHERALVTR